MLSFNGNITLNLIKTHFTYKNAHIIQMYSTPNFKKKY